VTALVKGLAHGVSPDGPEAEQYRAGDHATWHGPHGARHVLVDDQDGPWVEVHAPGSAIGFTVAEHELAPDWHCAWCGRPVTSLPCGCGR
jgi:hypothetical protein